MSKNYVETETAAGFRRVYKNSAVLVLTETPGVTWPGIVRLPGVKTTLVRYNEDGILRERKISNIRLVPVKMKPEADSSAGD